MSHTENQFVIQLDDNSKAAKDRRTRTQHFAAWLDDTEQHWTQPDLDAYRDFLEQQGKTDITITSYIGTIRRRYQDLSDTKVLRNILKQVEQHFGTTHNLDLVQQQIDSKRLRQQGKVDVQSPHTYEILSRADVMELFQQVDTKSLQGSRDLAIMGLMLCTGASAEETVALQVKHIDFLRGNVHIPETAGGMERTVKIRDDLFFAQPWLVDHIREHLRLMDSWKKLDDFLFQSFWRGGNTVRSPQLTLRGIHNMLQSYEWVKRNGDKGSPTAMHFRHTYARALYRAQRPKPPNESFDIVQDALGVKLKDTAQRNVGPPDDIFNWRGGPIQPEDMPEMEVK